MNEMASAFDAGASSFERYRALPDDVPEAVRSAIHGAVHLSLPARVLDLGAGTGRMGRIFAQAGDLYCGLDASLGMLQEFRRSTSDGFLVQADGRQLPFHDHVFDIVLLMHVLSGAENFTGIIHEARRVCNSKGAVVVGYTGRPESGMDAQLKQQLKLILQQLGIAWPQSQKSYAKALLSLQEMTRRHVHLKAASWNVETAPQDFLLRHRSGARFATLPAAIQEQTLQQLTTWAEKRFGALDRSFEEQRSFELDIFEF